MNYLKMFCILLFFVFNLVLYGDDNDLKLKASSCKFITDMVEDYNGKIWQTDEVNGLYVWEDKTQKWNCLNSQIQEVFTLQETSFYAIACDFNNRIWLGTLRDGVFIYDGKEWHNIKMKDGLLGDRIFCIKVNPFTGDVWIATSGGICVLNANTNQWELLTRSQGLPSDQILSISFDETNTYLATDCHGIVKINRNKNIMFFYKAPNTFYDTWDLPFTATGFGLPSNLCNEIIYTRDKNLVLATTTGIAISLNKGKKWEFIRGVNWHSKIKQLYLGKKEKPIVKMPSKEINQSLLLDDYISTIFDVGNNMLYVGTRDKGSALYNIKNKKMEKFFKSDAPRLFFQYYNQIWICEYSHGMRLLDSHTSNTKKNKSFSIKKPLPIPTFPLFTDKQISKMIQKNNKIINDLSSSKASFFYQDWKTRGDWLGRYGREYFSFSAHTSSMNPTSFKYETNRKFISNECVREFIGPHILDNDRLRHWIHWLSTEEPRSLWSPRIGTRRQSEIDDHGEAYHRDWEGPDVWLHIEPSIKDTPYRLSLYFYNKDGYARRNRFRDWIVEIHPSKGVNYQYLCDENEADPFVGLYLEKGPVPEIYNFAHWTTPIAKTRIRDFTGGVWVSFLIEKGSCWVKVGRNYSMNTFVNAVAIDYEDGKHPLEKHSYSYDHCKPPYTAPVNTNILLFKAIESNKRVLYKKNNVALYNYYRQNIYRYGLEQYKDDSDLSEDMKTILRWYAHDFNNDDHIYFDYKMKVAYFDEERYNILINSAEYNPTSPNKLFKSNKAAIESHIKVLELTDSSKSKDFINYLEKRANATIKTRKFIRVKQRIDENQKKRTLSPQGDKL